MAELASHYPAPYFEFPNKPNIIEVEKHIAYEYINREQLEKVIDSFSERFKLNQFSHLLVNLNGGNFFAQELLKRQYFKGELINIQYKENGQKVIPIPEFIKTLPSVGVIDDVLDKYITGKMILEDLPQAKILYLTKKVGVTPESQIKNCYWASLVDNKWLLGAGMNGEEHGDYLPQDWGRNYYGIAVKIA